MDPPGHASRWRTGGRRVRRTEPQLADLVVDRQWTLVSMEFSLHAIRHPEVARLLVEHELRVRSELAVAGDRGTGTSGRIPTLPVDELARMIVAVTEGSDIQALTDAAGGAVVHSDLGPRAVMALLQQFSVPTESVISPDEGDRSR